MTKIHQKKPNVAVVAFPWQAFAPYKFLSELLQILEPISNRIILIDGNTDRISVTTKNVEVKDIGIGMHYVRDIKPKFYSSALWILKCIMVQIKSSLSILAYKDSIDIVIFYMAYPYYILPLITAKLLNKKTVEVITRGKSNSFISKVISLYDPIFFKLLDGISFESDELKRYFNVTRYNDKILTTGERFIDSSLYSLKVKLSDRENIVGFVGRIVKEKGIVEFIDAIPMVHEKNKSISFSIVGSGDLSENISDKCNEMSNHSQINISISRFINENEFPDYLNKLKLLVLPTRHSEGLPTIVLEAMSCGTPVLITPVGAIPDIIKDNRTGFIMENLSREYIAEKIVKVLSSQDLDLISENASRLINNKYSYEAAVRRYCEIIN